MMIIRAAIYVILMPLFLSFAWIHPALSEWMSMERGWVRIHYHQADAGNVEAIIDAVNSGRLNIESMLGVEYRGRFDIYLASKSAEFGELTGWKLPGWTQGVALTEERIVVLKSPKFSGSAMDLAKAAQHEFIHIFLAEEVGRVPLWLNEGLAVFLSGEGYFDARTLHQASLGRKIISFREMESVLQFDPLKAQLAYSQALSAVQYLVAEFGTQALKKIFSGLSSGKNFDRAFFEATGLWPDEFENEWMDKVQSDYRFAFLKDLTYYLSFIFGPLAILSGVFLWYRRRKTILRWKEEERHSDYADFDY